MEIHSSPSGEDTFGADLVNAQVSLLRYLVALSGAQDAEDILQEVNRQLWARRGEYDRRRGSVLAWAIETAKWTARTWKTNALRDRQRFDHATVEFLAGRLAEPCPQEGRFLGWLRECLDALPSTSRRLVTAHHLEKMSLDEMSRHFGPRPGVLAVTLYRIRENLRRCVKGKERAGEVPVASAPASARSAEDRLSFEEAVGRLLCGDSSLSVHAVLASYFRRSDDYIHAWQDQVDVAVGLGILFPEQAALPAVVDRAHADVGLRWGRVAALLGLFLGGTALAVVVMARTIRHPAVVRDESDRTIATSSIPVPVVSPSILSPRVPAATATCSAAASPAVPVPVLASSQSSSPEESSMHANTSQSVTQTLVAAAAMAVITAVPPAAASSYGWAAADGVWADYGDVANWTVSGTAATVLPGAADELNPGFAANTTAAMNLGGQTYELGQWYVGGWDNPRHLAVTNGTLRFVGGTETYLRRGYMDVYAGGAIEFGSNTVLNVSDGDGAQSVTTIYPGGRFSVLGGTVKFYKWWVDIRDGGTFVFASEANTISGDQENWITNAGTCSFPHGFKWNVGSGAQPLRLVQTAGTMTFGGDMTMNGQTKPMTFEVRGGALVFVSNTAFSVSAASFAPGTTGRVEVAAGCRADLSGFAYGAGSSVVKTGPGTVCLGAASPAAFDIREGALGFYTSGAVVQVPSGVTAAAGTRLLLGATSLTTDVLPGGDYVFAVDTDVVPRNVAFFTSTNEAVRTRVRTDIVSGLPSDLGVEEIGDSLELVTVSPWTFNSLTTTDWNDPAGWACGFVPTNKDVLVKGTGVKARILGAIPACASIAISDGAEVSIETNLDLPPVSLAGDCVLTIGSETAASVWLTNGLACSASVREIPTLRVAAQGDLKVPPEMAFGNVNLMVYGGLSTTGIGHLFLGYAAAGATSYFGLTVDGGRLAISGGPYENGDYRIVCPAAGGTVIVPAPILLRDATLAHDPGNGFKIGLDNPTGLDFRVVCDGTRLGCYGPTAFAGAVDLVFTNGASLANLAVDDDYWVTITFSQRARAEFFAGTLLSFRLSNGGVGALAFNPDEDDYPSLTLDGGRLLAFHTAGNGRARLVCRGESAWEAYREARNTTVCRPFEGLRRVEIAEGARLSLRGVDTPAGYDKHLVLADVPVTGGGSLLITNAAPAYAFVVTVTNTANACTGTVSVAGGARLLFNNGANWAGTVVTGDIGLTNLLAGASFSTNSFGGLDLVADFPVRVGADGNDWLNLGQAGFSGAGRLILTGLSGFDWTSGPKYRIGSVLKTAARLPTVVAGSRTTKLADDPDDASRQLLEVGPTGFYIIICDNRCP